MTIIQLIQSEPARYKLDGQDKLRFIADMPDADSRLSILSAVLEALSQ